MVFGSIQTIPPKIKLNPYPFYWSQSVSLKCLSLVDFTQKNRFVCACVHVLNFKRTSSKHRTITIVSTVCFLLYFLLVSFVGKSIVCDKWNQPQVGGIQWQWVVCYQNQTLTAAIADEIAVNWSKIQSILESLYLCCKRINHTLLNFL